MTLSLALIAQIDLSCSYLSWSCSTIVPQLSHSCPTVIPWLSRSCPAAVPQLPRGCPAVVPQLSRGCPAVVPRLSRTCPVLVLHLSCSCLTVILIKQTTTECRITVTLPICVWSSFEKLCDIWEVDMGLSGMEVNPSLLLVLIGWFNYC